MKKQNFKREFSAGGVVYKRLKVQGLRFKVVFLLGKHSGYHKWVLPKGLIEEDEKPWQTAIRETEEEMGVKATLASEKPICVEKYVYWADLEAQLENSKSEARNSKQYLNSKSKNSKQCSNIAMKQCNNDKSGDSRRVLKYQEAGGKKTKVFKTVTFYLLEYISGDSKNHGWEMEEAGWFSFDEALEKLDFEGERKALKKAKLYIDK